MNKRRVVVTGMGVKSSVGNNLQTFFNNLKNGVHGIRPIEFFDCSRISVKLASYNYDFTPSDYFSGRELKRADRFCQFAIAAAADALDGQNLLNFYNDPFRIGVVFSSGIGGFATWQAQHENFLKKGPAGVSAFFIPMMISNMAAGMVSIATGFCGDNFGTASACASSNHAIGEAFHKIRDGYIDACVAGGTEAGMNEFVFAGFQNMMALTRATDQDAASIPFDRRRSGFVMGEGSAALVLEELECAKKRGAEIYCEIVGYGATCDAFNITKPKPGGVAQSQCMKKALADGEVDLAEVDYVNAHGTSTKINDETETAALRSLFKSHADNLLVSSTKSMTGHMLGAAGAVEAVATALSLKNGLVFPTVGLVERDEKCDLNYVAGSTVEKNIKTAISNSFGFGGHNACICFKKFEG